MAFLGDLLTSVADRGRALINFERFASNRRRPLDKLCEDLLSGRGEASGMALAQAVLDDWEQLDEAGRLAFFRLIANGSTLRLSAIATIPMPKRSGSSISPPSRAGRSCSAGSISRPAARMCLCACARACSRR